MGWQEKVRGIGGTEVVQGDKSTRGLRWWEVGEGRDSPRCQITEVFLVMLRSFPEKIQREESTGTEKVDCKSAKRTREIARI